MTLGITERRSLRPSLNQRPASMMPTLTVTVPDSDEAIEGISSPEDYEETPMTDICYSPSWSEFGGKRKKKDQERKQKEKKAAEKERKDQEKRLRKARDKESKGAKHAPPRSQSTNPLYRITQALSTSRLPLSQPSKRLSAPVGRASLDNPPLTIETLRKLADQPLEPYNSLHVVTDSPPTSEVLRMHEDEDVEYEKGLITRAYHMTLNVDDSHEPSPPSPASTITPDISNQSSTPRNASRASSRGRRRRSRSPPVVAEKKKEEPAVDANSRITDYFAPKRKSLDSRKRVEPTITTKKPSADEYSEVYSYVRGQLAADDDSDYDEVGSLAPSPEKALPKLPVGEYNNLVEDVDDSPIDPNGPMARRGLDNFEDTSFRNRAAPFKPINLDLGPSTEWGSLWVDPETINDALVASNAQFSFPDPDLAQSKCTSRRLTKAPRSRSQSGSKMSPKSSSPVVEAPLRPLPLDIDSAKALRRTAVMSKSTPALVLPNTSEIPEMPNVPSKSLKRLSARPAPAPHTSSAPVLPTETVVRPSSSGPPASSSASSLSMTRCNSSCSSFPPATSTAPTSMPNTPSTAAFTRPRPSMRPPPSTTTTRKRPPMHPLGATSYSASASSLSLTAQKPMAKLFVICCGCQFWHDMPAKVYQAMAKPKLLETDEADVKCNWCAHPMNPTCCAGWTTVVYLHERHH